MKKKYIIILLCVTTTIIGTIFVGCGNKKLKTENNTEELCGTEVHEDDLKVLKSSSNNKIINKNKPIEETENIEKTENTEKIETKEKIKEHYVPKSELTGLTFKIPSYWDEVCEMSEYEFEGSNYISVNINLKDEDIYETLFVIVENPSDNIKQTLIPIKGTKAEFQKNNKNYYVGAPIEETSYESELYKKVKEDIPNVVNSILTYEELTQTD